MVFLRRSFLALFLSRNAAPERVARTKAGCRANTKLAEDFPAAR